MAQRGRPNPRFWCGTDWVSILPPSAFIYFARGALPQRDEHNHEYIFNFDHFFDHAPPADDPAASASASASAAAATTAAAQHQCLCVDARMAGNVARFINHAPEAPLPSASESAACQASSDAGGGPPWANLTLQPVMTTKDGMDKPILYRRALAPPSPIPPRGPWLTAAMSLQLAARGLGLGAWVHAP